MKRRNALQKYKRVISQNDVIAFTIGVLMVGHVFAALTDDQQCLFDSIDILIPNVSSAMGIY